MTNYIKTFSDETAYQQFTESQEYVTPNVSYCSGGSNSVFFNPLEKHDYSKDYFTLVALEDGQFKITGDGCGVVPMLSHYYSIDNGQTWTELEFGTFTPTITAGNKVLWKSNMPTENMVGTFVSTGSFDVEGNIMSLVYGDNFEGQTSLQGYSHPFYGLFYGCSVINANNLSLPATTLAMACYDSMFGGCTSLTTAPSILPATTLANSCYVNMFQSCSGLTTAPELPATALTPSCYNSMFLGCRSLTTAPELPAETLARYCYYGMFRDCTSLNSITCLATDISADACTQDWVSGVASSGIFTKAASMTNWTTGTSGIPNGWTVVDKL